MHQQEASHRNVAVLHLNMDWEKKKCNSKHVKSTIYCISLLIPFGSDTHPKLSLQSIYILDSAWHIFPEKTRKLISFL